MPIFSYNDINLSKFSVSIIFYLKHFVKYLKINKFKMTEILKIFEIFISLKTSTMWVQIFDFCIKPTFFQKKVILQISKKF